MRKRCLAFLHGAVFIGTHLYAIGFLAKVVLHASGAAPADGVARNAVVDAALLLGVAIQHGLVAQRGFAAWLARRGGDAGAGHAYLFASSRALIALFVFWRPLGVGVWTVDEPAAVVTLDVLRIAGVALLVWAIVVINRRGTFGLRQIWLYLAWTKTPPVVIDPYGPYRVMRHPLYVGALVALWAAPAMSAEHFLCATIATAYVLVAIRLEERALVVVLGDAYRGYRRAVPMLVPSLAALRGRRRG